MNGFEMLPMRNFVVGHDRNTLFQIGKAETLGIDDFSINRDGQRETWRTTRDPLFCLAIGVFCASA